MTKRAIKFTLDGTDYVLEPLPDMTDEEALKLVEGMTNKPETREDDEIVNPPPPDKSGNPELAVDFGFVDPDKGNGGTVKPVSPAKTSAVTSGEAQGGPVNLNTASVAALVKLPVIGNVMVLKIVSARVFKKFESVEDAAARVDKKLLGIKDLLTV